MLEVLNTCYGIMSDDKFDYAKTLLVYSNLAILFWVAIATISIWLLYEAVAWVFLIFASATIWLLLRRIGCSTCAYCKSCTSGFGRLSAWFFGKRELKDFRNKTALAFVIFIYCLTGLFPAGLLAFSVFQAFSMTHMIMLVSLTLILIFSLATWIKIRPRNVVD